MFRPAHIRISTAHVSYHILTGGCRRQLGLLPLSERELAAAEGVYSVQGLTL